MFVKSEFPLDSALACDSDPNKFGWHFFVTSKVIKSKMAAVEFMKCTLCHIFVVKKMPLKTFFNHYRILMQNQVEIHLTQNYTRPTLNIDTMSPPP